MAPEELGSIEKPESGPVLGKRKVYVVQMVSAIPGAPDEYGRLLKEYWAAVDRNVNQLEARAGIASHIFHEGVFASGDLGLKLVAQINQPGFAMVKNRMAAGAALEAFESEDLFSQVVDWGRCLQVGLSSRAVAGVIQEKYREAAEARFEKMSAALDEKIGGSEAAVLIASDLRGLKLPEGAEVFNVMPPELDRLVRWTRDFADRAMTAAQAEADGPGDGEAGGAAPEAGDEGPKLWTPGS